MNLSKLFKIQKQLDERIVKEKGLEGQDLLDKKILALQVELGELAQNWRGFKFWSNDQEPRTKVKKVCETCGGERYILISESFGFDKCSDCDGKGDFGETNPLLEEYVDCLHFILSIGLDLEIDYNKLDLLETCSHLPITTIFSELMVMLPDCLLGHGKTNKESAFEMYDICLSNFIELGKMLGFTWEQVEQAYLTKNKINHERLESGY